MSPASAPVVKFPLPETLFEPPRARAEPGTLPFCDACDVVLLLWMSLTRDAADGGPYFRIYVRASCHAQYCFGSEQTRSSVLLE